MTRHFQRLRMRRPLFPRSRSGLLKLVRYSTEASDKSLAFTPSFWNRPPRASKCPAMMRVGKAWWFRDGRSTKAGSLLMVVRQERIQCNVKIFERGHIEWRFIAPWRTRSQDSTASYSPPRHILPVPSAMREDKRAESDCRERHPNSPMSVGSAQPILALILLIVMLPRKHSSTSRPGSRGRE